MGTALSDSTVVEDPSSHPCRAAQRCQAHHTQVGHRAAGKTGETNQGACVSCFRCKHGSICFTLWSSRSTWNSDFFIFYIFSLIDDGWWAGRQGYRGVQSDLGGHHICAGALKKQNKNIYNSLNL